MTSTPAVTAAESAGPSRILLALMSRALPLAFIGIIVLFVALGAPNFFSFGNASDIIRLCAPIMVVAGPMALLLILGHVDLSVGSNLALSAVVAGLLVTVAGFHPALAIVCAIAVSALVGLANGLLVTFMGLSPIIVTLGMLTGIRGLALLLAPNNIYAFFPQELAAVSYTGLWGIPYFGMIAAVIVLIGVFLLSLAPFGRHARAIGVNEEAAFLSGINVRGIIIWTYTLTGASAGVAGIMYALLLNSAPSGTLGLLFELDVLIGVMLGGVAFNGGRGTIGGVVLGVLFLAVLQNGLILLSVPTSVGLVVKGVVLVLAAMLDRATVKAQTSAQAR